MEIKKIGHCCLFIKIGDLTILTDPGSFSVEQDNLIGIDIVLITHEHADHMHVGSIENILKNNPNIVILTNASVAKKLNALNIKYSLLNNRQIFKIKEMEIEAFDCKHEEIFQDIGQVQNTGYLINKKLFYPGDSFFNPNIKVDILALPVAGPWCKISDSVRYALEIKPKIAFPVHDGMLRGDRIGSAHTVPLKILSENGIEFIEMKDGDTMKFK